MKHSVHNHNIDNSVPILMYHEITNKDNFSKISKQLQYSYILDIEHFKLQLEYLKTNNYHTLNTIELMKMFKFFDKTSEEAKSKQIMLTFDDGFIGNYQNVFPALISNNFCGLFFLITSRVNTKYMLTWDNIREMAKYGMEFGSHTQTHALLGNLSRNEIFNELDRSKKKIEDEIGREVVSLSLPHGSYNSEYKDEALKIGYSFGVTSDPGLNRTDSDPFFLKRMNVPQNASLPYFVGLCGKHRFLYGKVRMKKRIIAIFKKIFGEPFYLSMYNKIFGVENL